MTGKHRATTEPQGLRLSERARVLVTGGRYFFLWMIPERGGQHSTAFGLVERDQEQPSGWARWRGKPSQESPLALVLLQNLANPINAQSKQSFF